MTDGRWQRIEDIFRRAIDLTPDSRSAFLEEVCGTDHSLRCEVESLLAHDKEDGRTFANPWHNSRLRPRCPAPFPLATDLGPTKSPALLAEAEWVKSIARETRVSIESWP